jgi:hypothetical protein
MRALQQRDASQGIAAWMQFAQAGSVCEIGFGLSWKPPGVRTGG